MKRNLIILFAIILAAVAGFFFFAKDEITFTKETSAYKAVPVTAPFFIEFQDLKSAKPANPAMQELRNAGIAANFFASIFQIDSLIQNNDDLPKSLRNEPFLLSFDFTGKNQLEPLLIINTGSTGKQKAVQNLINVLFPKNGYQYQTRHYDNEKVTEISGISGGKQIVYSFSEGLFLASSSSILVEQSIRQKGTQGILKNPYFNQAFKTVSSQSKISFFVNHEQFPTFLQQLLNRKTNRKSNEFGGNVNINYRNIIEAFGDFAAWSELDADFNDDHFSLAGISAADDSLNHFLAVFENQQPVRSIADDILPENTSFYCSFSFSDSESFFNRLETYFTNTGFYYKREEILKKIESGFRADIKKIFREMIDGEVIVATTNIPVNPENKTSFFILRTKGRSSAEEQMNMLLSTYAAKKDIPMENLKSVYKIDDELRYDIYRFPYPSFPGTWLGQPFSAAEAQFAVFYNNLLVFSNSEKGLHEYLHSMALKSTLGKDMRYLRFRQNISGRSNINIFLDVNRAFGLSNTLFSEELGKTIGEKEESLRKFWAINWQLQRNKDIFFNSIEVGFNEKAHEEAQTTWQSTIGSNIIIKPAIVVNHDDPQNREIIIQDEQNNLHQITAEGRIRWSVSIPEKIMSEIHQVDYYKNGKLQYLFNTKNKLYIIDRNGHNVAHFPVDLRSPATNGVNVFDYENTRNYRYFVAGEDKKVYAYDYAGRVIGGWKFGKTDSEVTTPVQHFRIGRRDYIVFKDKSQVYILDRRGTERVSISAQFENSRNPLVLNLNGTPKIVATDTGGQVYYLFFNGKYEKKVNGKFSENHFFTCEDLNGNGTPDFVFLDGNELTVTDESGKKLYREKYDHAIQYPPNIYDFGAKQKNVGVVDAAENRIYLYNPDGKMQDGFPLQGNSEFSVGVISENSGLLNLIVGSDGGSLYNYTLN